MTLSSLGANTSTPSNALAADARSLNALKLDAGNTSPAAIKESAKQFESLFMRELIKSMREATMKSGMLDSPGGDLGADLLDQQMAVTMSGRPGGLSEMIAKQLTKQAGLADPSADNPAAGNTSSTFNYTPTVNASSLSGLDNNRSARSSGISGSNNANGINHARSALASSSATNTQAGFVQRHSAAAKQAEAASGLPAGYMIGQAGHETGWGKHEIKNADGSPSFNLFGIKPGAGWTGKVAEVTTTEYVNGKAQKVVSKFRAYSSYEESFKDYARMINESPRYAKARQQTGSAQSFASGLQRAGYATDPNYAAKLSRAINTTLNIQRVQT